MSIKGTDLLLSLLFLIACCVPASAQTTTFTYQGKLANNGAPVTGNYDFEFRLFDLQSGGTQQGSTLTLTNVSVANGIFAVQLDFVACATCVPCPSCFNGSNRFLDITVRPAGGGSFTPLSPRQPMTSDPYAIKSLNAGTADGLSLACVSCVTSSQIGSVNGSSVTGTIPVGSIPPGNGNYIQNTTSTQTADFNISGNGIVGGSIGLGSILPGYKLNITGSGIVRARINSDNNGGLSFALADVPKWSLATVSPNGDFQLFNDATSTLALAVSSTTSRVGIGTAFPNFKMQIVDSSNTGLRVQTNSLGGTVASFGGLGAFNVDSSGVLGGRFTILENGNVGIGANNPAQKLRVSGIGVVRATVNSDSNAGFGLALGDVQKWSIATTNGNFQLFNDAATSNAMIIDGTSNNVGIGAVPNFARLSVDTSGDRGLVVTTGTFGGVVAEFGSHGSLMIDSTTTVGGRLAVLEDSTVQINSPSGNLTDNTDKLIVNGFIRANFASGGGTSTLCFTPTQQIGRCLSSSIRYKENIDTFTPGLDLISRLRPVTFDWKINHNHDLGLVAEEVAQVEPLLVTYENGQIEGVKYDRIAVVLLNAIREQQEQIKKQFDLIQRQQHELSAQKGLLRNQQLQLVSLKRVVHKTNSRNKR